MNDSESRNPMFNFQDCDEFLSEEDLDIGNLPWPERIKAWNLWLATMQATNDQDKDDYSHGVFLSERQKRELWGDEDDENHGADTASPPAL
ncbi:MAG: hypothetical protein KY445_04550 [Armatimonadetes bacterium]|nr:hypothetical protein [Armatimonadota bacterium]